MHTVVCKGQGLCNACKKASQPVPDGSAECSVEVAIIAKDRMLVEEQMGRVEPQLHRQVGEEVS